MIKYSVPEELVKELVKKGSCKTEQEALEKVASGSVSPEYLQGLGWEVDSITLYSKIGDSKVVPCQKT